MGRAMDEEWEGLYELVRCFGWRRAAEILGSCLVLAVMEGGAEAASESVRDATPAQATRYRLYQDGRKFREYLRERGKEHLLGEPGKELQNIGEMARNAPPLGELRLQVG